MAFIERRFEATEHTVDRRTVASFKIQKTFDNYKEEGGAGGRMDQEWYDLQIGNARAVMTSAQTIKFAEGLLDLLPPTTRWSTIKRSIR